MERRPGFVAIRVVGPGAGQLFADEAGGHRFQRIPPTEKKGRVQTSTVTVAVLGESSRTRLEIPDRDLEWRMTRGSGAGGQKRNKVETCAVVRHLPTGITVRCEEERSQHRNRSIALERLRSLLEERERSRVAGDRDASRRGQVGSGMRGDKRRTIRYQDGQVTDHLTGRTWRLKDYLRGEW